MLAVGSAVTRQRQGAAEDLKGATGKVPGKKERAGAQHNGASTVRQRERLARRCSTAAGSLWWSSTSVEGSYSTGVEGGREI
jgi:hypothetical protein